MSCQKFKHIKFQLADVAAGMLVLGQDMYMTANFRMPILWGMNDMQFLWLISDVFVAQSSKHSVHTCMYIRLGIKMKSCILELEVKRISQNGWKPSELVRPGAC